MRINQITESGDKNDGKKFEDDVVTLALLSGANPDMDLNALYKDNADKFNAPKIKDQTVSAVEGLHRRFPDQVWTTGYNSNPDKKDKSSLAPSIPKPKYGSPTAKSDIVLNDIPFSVKMAGAFVVASAQNKDEFNGIFQTAIDYYAQQKGLDLHIDEHVQQLQETIKDVRDNYIGEVFSQIKSKDRQIKVLNKFKDVSELYTEFEEYINNIEDKLVDKYQEAFDNLKQNILVTLKEQVSRNEELNEYIIWEALSSTLKYDGQFPYAPYVLSPKGVADISTPSKDYVKQCAKVSSFSIRGLPTGSMRSGSSTFAKRAKKQYTAGSTDVAKIFDEMGAMALNLKIDVGGPASKKLPVDESMIVEGINIGDLWRKVVSSIKEWISALGEKLKALISKANELKQATLGDWVSAVGIEAEGIIKMP